MGCDIHTYIEYATPNIGECELHWSSFTRNGGSRNYAMFGVLAGVRAPGVALFTPKGMPFGPISYQTADDYWVNVASEAHPEWAEHDGFTSLETAERWVSSGSSIGQRDADGRLTRVSGPDWHSHSWLTTAELAQAIDRYQFVARDRWPGDDGNVPAEWAAMLAAMRALEAAGKLTRIVFWFDN